jgi:hypothetical protein
MSNPFTDDPHRNEIMERVKNLNEKDYPDRVSHFCGLVIKLRDEKLTLEEKCDIEFELCFMYMTRK